MLKCPTWRLFLISDWCHHGFPLPCTLDDFNRTTNPHLHLHSKNSLQGMHRPPMNEASLLRQQFTKVASINLLGYWRLVYSFSTLIIINNKIGSILYKLKKCRKITRKRNQLTNKRRRREGQGKMSKDVTSPALVGNHT